MATVFWGESAAQSQRGDAALGSYYVAGESAVTGKLLAMQGPFTTFDEALDAVPAVRLHHDSPRWRVWGVLWESCDDARLLMATLGA
jgi:hypothetical protein